MEKVREVFMAKFQELNTTIQQSKEKKKEVDTEVFE